MNRRSVKPPSAPPPPPSPPPEVDLVEGESSPRSFVDIRFGDDGGPDEEDDLPPPPCDDDPLGPPPDFDDDFPPLNDDEDSLLSLDSDDDKYFCDLDDLGDPELDDHYIEYHDDIPDEPPESDLDVPTSDDESLDNPSELPEQAGPVTLEAHPIYSKYFKMLKVGMPLEIVSGKMKQDGIDCEILKLDPTSVAPDDLTPALLGRRRAIVHRGGALLVGGPPPPPTPASLPPTPPEALSRSPSGAHSQGTPSPALPPPPPPPPQPRGSMSSPAPPAPPAPPAARPSPPPAAPPAAPLAPATLPVYDNCEKVAASEHPVYSKYFRMMKVGLPKHAVAAKLQQDGLDTAIAELDPQTLVPLAEIRAFVPKADTSPAASSTVRVPRESQVRKKKLFLTAVNKQSLTEDSLWADGGADDLVTDITLDSEEFDRLFVESADAQAKLKSKAARIEAEDQRDKMKKIKGVTLISLKRAQNAAIALARIKLSYDEIRRLVEAFDDSLFSVEQLKALLEFVATDEEALLLTRYTGDVNDLGLAEKYMLTMLACVGVKVRLQALLVRKQFLPRWHDVRNKLKILADACDEIKKSVRLRKVLKTILKVANQLNDEHQAGITVESLVKLATIKAFDKKTSVLQYVIMLILRHDSDALKFPDDLAHLAEASRLGLDSLVSEKAALVAELTGSLRALRSLHEHRCRDDEALAKVVAELDTRFSPMCGELDKRVSALTANFQSILKYFSEDAKLTCQEFFVPLFKFVEDFIRTRDAIERQRLADERKKRIDEAKKDKERAKEEKAKAKEKAPNMAQARRRMSLVVQAPTDAVARATT